MIGNDWDEILKEEFNKEYFNELIKFIDNEYESQTIYPKYEDIFNALKLINFNEVKVVILGQDPYHGINQAHGLSFSVQEGIKIPPSLRNIFKELYNDLNIEKPTHGNLESWAKQGVLLLNSVLTVQKELAASHRNKGWEIFTDQIIKELAKKDTPIVFILWGTFARNKKEYITKENHYTIESVHPSPLSANRGFLGSKPFSKTNQFLRSNNITIIDWEIK